VVSTGGLFRAAIKARSTLGRIVEKYVQDGHLVPHPLTMSVVAEAVDAAGDASVVLDGFPRTIEQAVDLDRLRRVDVALELRVDIDTLVARLANRFICAGSGHVFADGGTRRCPIDGSVLGRRADDESGIVRQRLRTQHEALGRVITWYRDGHRLRTIHGALPVMDVTSQILDALSDDGSSPSRQRTT
jgi:adenylate kinase